MPGLVGDWDVAQVRQCLLGGGFATLGRAATTDVTPEGLAACVSFALDGGLFAGFMPASRARSAMVLGLVGSEILAKEPASAGRLESAMERLSGDLPQARRLHGVYQDAGKWARVMAFLGGLPFPETLATERARRR